MRDRWHRLILFLTGLTTVLFQTHWVDDLGTDERDVLGWGVTLAVALTLVSSLAAVLVLTTRIRRSRAS
jgi:hypothetical protein